ncbi:MAG: preprotein translocase subunit YajC [Acidimicrobiales bacterium]
MEFIPLIVVGVLMYAVLILPQQRRNREHKTLLASLEEGDEVLTSAGVYGFVAAVDGEVVWLEVADGVELKVSKSSVANKVVLKGEPDEPDEDEEG